MQAERGEGFGASNQPRAVGAGPNCSVCGGHVVPGNRFCTLCGTPIGEVTTPALSPPAFDVSHVEVEPMIEQTRRPRSRWIVLGVAVLLAAGAAVVVVRSRGGESSGSSSAAVRTPPFGLVKSVDTEAWSTDVDEVIDVQVADDRVLVLSGYTDPDLTALSLSSGEEQWSVDLDVEYASIDVVADGRVLLTATDNEGADSLLLSLDAGSGEEQWQKDVDDGILTMSEDRLLFLSYGTKTTVEVIDPATGDSVQRFRHDQIYLRSGRLVAIDDDELLQFSLDTLDEIGEPIPWDADYTNFIVVGAGVYVINDGDEVIRLDKSGKEAWSASTGDDALYWLTDLGNGLIAVEGDDGIVVGRERGDDFEEVWSTDGVVSDVFSSRGTVVVSVYDDVELSFVNAATGDEMTSMKVAPEETNFWPMSDGAIVRLDDDSAEFAGLSLPGGDELWSFSEDFASIEPFAGGVLVVVPNLNGDEFTITRLN